MSPLMAFNSSRSRQRPKNARAAALRVIQDNTVSSFADGAAERFTRKAEPGFVIDNFRTGTTVLASFSGERQITAGIDAVDVWGMIARLFGAADVVPGGTPPKSSQSLTVDASEVLIN